MTKAQGRPARLSDNGNVVDLLRERAALRPRRKAFVFLKDGELFVTGSLSDSVVIRGATTTCATSRTACAAATPR